jgi:two-component system response regulator ResD
VHPYHRVVADVMVVEDDVTVASVVVSYLERAGHRATSVSDGKLAIEAIADHQPDLLVLDRMLPHLDGMEICRRVRQAWPTMPLVMLTALGEPDDRIAGLELGADDYVTKPFSPRELVLRIESVLRRATAGAPPATQTLSAGGITADAVGRRAFRDGVELALTVRELDLLVFLMSHPGQAFTREQLMRLVWGWTYGDQSTVTVHVRRLRAKIETDPARPAIIRTVWGVGYRFESTAAA